MTDFPLQIEEISAGDILDDGLRKVTAFRLEHPLECYGYRVVEHDKPGALNARALKAAGVTPGPLFQALKAGKTVTLADGRQINGADYLAPAVAGKSVAIFGDTAPCEAALALAQGVDVMVMKPRWMRQWRRKPTLADTAPPVKPRRWRGKLPSVG